jgi:hypothetical protein
VFFISFDFDLDQFEYVLHVVEVGLLVDQLVLHVLNSLPVLVVEVLKGIDDVQVLEGDERLLEDPEVEHLYKLQRVHRHFVRERLQHQHDI